MALGVGTRGGVTVAPIGGEIMAVAAAVAVVGVPIMVAIMVGVIMGAGQEEALMDIIGMQMLEMSMWPSSHGVFGRRRRHHLLGHLCMSHHHLLLSARLR